LQDSWTSAEREPVRHSPYGPAVEARQKALGVDFWGNWLKENEISSLERFQNIESQVPLNQKIVWIPYTPGTKTSDFLWISRDNRMWEMKSPDLALLSSRDPKSQGLKITGIISQDADFKDRFIIDIGDIPLTHELQRQLQLYNVRRSDAPHKMIKEMVIMSTGCLHDVILRE